MLEDARRIIISYPYTIQCWMLMHHIGRLSFIPSSLPKLVHFLTSNRVESGRKAQCAYVPYQLWLACNERLFRQMHTPAHHLIKKVLIDS